MLSLSALQALLISELAFFPQYQHAFGAAGVAVTVILGVLAQISGSAAASPAKELAQSLPASSSATVVSSSPEKGV